MADTKSKTVPVPVEVAEDPPEPITGDIFIRTVKFDSTYIDDEDAAQQFKALHKDAIKPETVQQTNKRHDVGVGLTYTFTAEPA
jgi:hypothetical protein